MKAAFNGVCSICERFKPRCASVFLRWPGKATEYQLTLTVLCEDCRKRWHGAYKLDMRHKSEVRR